MNHIKACFFLLLCITLLSGCNTENTSTSKSNKKEESIETKEKLNVKITLNKKIKDNKKILISGKSNLPKDTALSIDLKCPECSTYYYDLSTGVNVKESGMFEYEFSNEEGEEFEGGKYIAYVETAPDHHQTDAVREVFGENGANLVGSNVSDDYIDHRATAEINFKIKNSSKVKQKSKKDNAAEVTKKKNEELSTLKREAEYKIESIVEDNYKAASIEKIEINQDMSTDQDNKLIALVYLSFDFKNSAQTSYNMVEMFSDDLASKIGTDNNTINQIAVFWKVPYIDEKETVAKFSYERSGKQMKITDKVSSLK
ncbi:hypothetical protein [Bacillus pumilus]|uniref:hypothetical protein n=1 Tax=Bacillus pumilus TaxID=1408 RepID=UPI001E29C6F3|nr:hypothetical protein [Bacillus pumilus]MCC9087953.1 hypothetical protein [Bacillus pumilus]